MRTCLCLFIPVFSKIQQTMHSIALKRALQYLTFDVNIRDSTMIIEAESLSDLDAMACISSRPLPAPITNHISMHKV